MKVKKIIAAACAIILSASAAGFAGCDFSIDDLMHTHSIDTSSWQCDESGHWHACAGCDKKLDFAEHSYASQTSVSCSYCGWIRSAGGDASDDNPTAPDDKDKEDNTGNTGDTGDTGNTGNTGDTPDEQDKPQGATISDSDIAQYAASSYGYEWLGKQSKGAKLQAYYEQIDACCQKVNAGTATINYVSGYYTVGKIESTELGSDDVKNVYRIYLHDHPYNFWQSTTVLSGSTTQYGKTNYYTYVLLSNGYNNTNGLKKVAADKTIIDANIKKMYTAGADKQTTYEKVAAYYSSIALSCDYTYKAANQPSDEYWAHSIVGILDDDASTGPVCEGYARVFQLMLNLNRIDNVYCIGTATSAGTGGGGGHAWNMVKLEDDMWYYFDLTWDDANDAAASGGVGGTVGYEYFALCSTQKTQNKYLFTDTHKEGNPHNKDYYLYDLPKVASLPYAGTQFGLNSTVADNNFVYVRNGIDTVGIKQIKTTANIVTIPSAIKLGERQYTVTELGPYIGADGKYTTILTKNYTRQLILPATVTAVKIAAFNCVGQITVWYGGTREQWGKVAMGEAAFYNQPVVYCDGEWEMFLGRPVAK